MVDVERKFGFMILENIRPENYQGYTIDESEINGINGFIDEAKEKTRNKENLIASYAVGASKCNIKNLKDVAFVKDQQRASVLWAQILEEYDNDLCLFKFDNYLFKSKEGQKNRSNETADNLENAVKLFKKTNLSKDLSIVGVYGPQSQRLTRKTLTNCQVEKQEGIYSLLFAKRLKDTQTLVA